MANSKGDTKEVKEKRHYPQSYFTYREKNPTLSIKLTKKTKDALDQARGDMSYSEFLKSLVISDGVFAQFERQRAQLASERAALVKEKGELVKVERFTVPCKKCGKPMVFRNQKEEYWNKEVKPRLQQAFSTFQHAAGSGCRK
jgi:predicted transcriptional regulator